MQTQMSMPAFFVEWYVVKEGLRPDGTPDKALRYFYGYNPNPSDRRRTTYVLNRYTPNLVALQDAQDQDILRNLSLSLGVLDERDHPGGLAFHLGTVRNHVELITSVFPYAVKDYANSDFELYGKRSLEFLSGQELWRYFNASSMSNGSGRIIPNPAYMNGNGASNGANTNEAKYLKLIQGHALQILQNYFHNMYHCDTVFLYLPKTEDRISIVVVDRPSIKDGKVYDHATKTVYRQEGPVTLDDIANAGYDELFKSKYGIVLTPNGISGVRVILGPDPEGNALTYQQHASLSGEQNNLEENILVVAAAGTSDLKRLAEATRPGLFNLEMPRKPRIGGVSDRILQMAKPGYAVLGYVTIGGNDGQFTLNLGGLDLGLEAISLTEKRRFGIDGEVVPDHNPNCGAHVWPFLTDKTVRSLDLNDKLEEGYHGKTSYNLRTRTFVTEENALNNALSV